MVKNHIEKDLGLYAAAEELEKEMQVCQGQIDRYYQDPVERRRPSMIKLLRSTRKQRRSGRR